jgi:hypothetical protein
VEERHLFGEIAIEKGFLTLQQLRRALDIQREMIRSGEGHKLIGVLLVELGYLTPDQVCEILETHDRENPAKANAQPETDTMSMTVTEEPDPLLPS